MATPEARAIAEAYERGDAIDWTVLYGSARPIVRVTQYAFERRRYWFDDVELPSMTASVRRLRPRERAVSSV